MGASLPIFCLGSVVFPGATVGLHVFEDRYRAMVRHLLEVPADDRVFGIVAIREGFEVGEKAVQSAHRVGCEVFVEKVVEHADGTFDLGVRAVRRVRVDAMMPAEEFLWGEVERLSDDDGPGAEEAATRAHAVFEVYASELRGLTGVDVNPDAPEDPVALSYALAESAVLTAPDRQSLLEAPDATSRLDRLSRLLVEEIAAIRAVPSLPAVEVARTGWCPN